MSEFSHLCADTMLWDPTTKTAWGSLDFCPMITQFQLCTITQTQLFALSQAGAWGEAKKPRWDMAFLMIVPSINAGGEELFSLAVVWVHPCQGCLTTLVEAAQKLMMLADDIPDWLYAFICMSDTVTCSPSNNGHISTMMDGMCTLNACGRLQQL